MDTTVREVHTQTMETDASATSRIVLASGSPRRRTLLAWLGVPFDVAAADIDESIAPGAAPEDIVLDLAERKARAVAASGDGGSRLIVAADTAVALDGDILGKPADDAAALEMLRRLAGHSHEVWT